MKKQKPLKYKKVLYELKSDSETENIEHDRPETEVDEIEEEQEKNEQLPLYKIEKANVKQTVKKRKLKIFDYLNSEQDAKKNMN